MIKQNGIKPTRVLNAALYAWLYRNDKNWLLETNQRFYKKHIPQGTKVDWYYRDLFFVKQLIQLNNNLLWDLDSPRRSANWWIKQIKYNRTIGKSLTLLPITQLFLRKYSEDISCYQIRRLSKVLIEMTINQQNLSRWVILRKAGLSDERLRVETNSFLTTIIS